MNKHTFYFTPCSVFPACAADIDGSLLGKREELNRQQTPQRTAPEETKDTGRPSPEQHETKSPPIKQEPEKQECRERRVAQPAGPQEVVRKREMHLESTTQTVRRGLASKERRETTFPITSTPPQIYRRGTKPPIHDGRKKLSFE